MYEEGKVKRQGIRRFVSCLEMMVLSVSFTLFSPRVEVHGDERHRLFELRRPHYLIDCFLNLAVLPRPAGE